MSVSKFDKACASIVENLDTSKMGVVEFTWEEVKDEKHKSALLSILKNGFLFNQSVDRLFAKAQKNTNLNDPHRFLLKSSQTSSRERQITQDGNKIVLRIEGIPVDPAVKKISEEFMHNLSIDIQYGMDHIVNWNPKLYPNGRPKCWKFTSKLKGKYAELTDRLPELEGIFEANKPEDQAILRLTFSKLSPEDKELIVKYVQLLDDPNDEVKVISDTVVQYIQHDIAYEWHKEESKKTYPAFKHTMLCAMLRMYDIPLTKRETRSFISRIFKNCRTEVLLSKYADLTDRLPELEGIFEAAEINPEFHLMNKEERAIEEIAETVQKLFQDYEDRVVALMTNLKRTRLSLQDVKLNKYIGITHLRNDLRLSVGKICKKHFESIESSNPNFSRIYNQYERIFVKPITGSSGIYVEGGAVLIYEDEVFEVVFDTYDYTLGEQIAESKVIEPIEIKEYLKKLLSTWLNATVTRGQYYFTKEYLEFRKEKTKYRPLTNRLPELEGIFESSSDDDVVDIVIEVNKTDSSGRQKTTQPILEILSKHIQELLKILNQNSGINPEFKCVIKKDSPKIILTNIPKDAAQRQIAYLEREMYLNRWINVESKLNLDYSYTFDSRVFKSIKVDENSARFRKTVERLPELEGLFDSIDDNVVDVVAELESTDSQGSKTTQPILELIAKYLRSQTCINMEETWENPIKPWFNYTIKNNPPKIIFTNIPKSIAKTYLMELKEAIFFADRYIGSTLGEDYSYYFSSLLFKKVEIDENLAKLRKTVERLPELGGIFESTPESEQPAYVMQLRFKSLDQNEKYLLLKILKWRQEYWNDAKGEIIEKDNELILTKSISQPLPEYSDKNIVKRSLGNSFRVSMDYVYPTMKVEFANAFINSIFDKLVVSCIQKNHHDLEQRLPELEGIFESEDQTLKKYNLIDPLKLKSADDFRELWMGYKFADESSVDKIFELFSLFPQKKLDKYQISLKRIDDPKQVVVVVKSNPDQLYKIKRDVEISEIGDTLANQIRNEIYMLHYDYDISSRSNEDIHDFNELHWRFQDKCHFLGIKTKWSDMNERLPELEGIFEEKNNDDAPASFGHLYATFQKIRDKEISDELGECLKKLKLVLEAEEGHGRANLAKCECEITKIQDRYCFTVKRVPFSKIESHPKQKHHAENHINKIFWERLWSVLLTKNCPAKEWLRAHLQIYKYEWKDSNSEELMQRMPELNGIF